MHCGINRVIATLDEIKEAHSEHEVHMRLMEVIPEYLNDGWGEEFSDIIEAHEEQGRGEAEMHVVEELIEGHYGNKDEMGTNAYAWLVRKVAEHFGLDL